MDLSGGGSSALIGYRAKRHTGVIDVDRVGAYDVEEFWEPLLVTPQKRLILDPDEFYILASKESVSVPPAYAAEMEPFNALMGEFRVHYAGFFDPGFGMAATGGEGSRAVLEVRSHKVPFILEDGQIIGRLIYEPLTAVPAQLYGQDIGSHYQAQALKLSKHFREVRMTSLRAKQSSRRGHLRLRHAACVSEATKAQCKLFCSWIAAAAKAASRCQERRMLSANAEKRS